MRRSQEGWVTEVVENEMRFMKMRSEIVVRALLAGWVCMGSVQAQESAPEGGEATGTPPGIWKRIIPELAEIRMLEDRHESLPRFALFGTDRGDNREQIQELLAESVAVLGESEATALRAELFELEGENDEFRARIADLKEKRVSAPDEAIFADTVSRIDDQIDRLLEAIDENEEAIEEKRARFADQVAATGLDLSRDQVDFLLSTVVGDEIIDISIAFYNVKLITADLEKLTSESLEDMEIARRYYGMYTVLLRSMDVMYESSLREIDEGYLVEIENVVTRTKELTKKTRRMQSDATEDHRAALAGNIRAQEFTLEAAELYRAYLEDQRKGLREAREKLQQNLAVAENTYETVKISGDLLRVMRASEDLFDLLFNLQVPELRPFENIELRREFEKLTGELRRSGS